MQGHEFKIDKQVYTVDEIRKILDIGKSQAYNLVKDSPFPVKKIRGQIRISKEGFDKWLAAND